MVCTTATQPSLTEVSDFHYKTKKFETWTFDVTILTSNYQQRDEKMLHMAVSYLTLSLLSLCVCVWGGGGQWVRE